MDLHQSPSSKDATPVPVATKEPNSTPVSSRPKRKAKRRIIIKSNVSKEKKSPIKGKGKSPATTKKPAPAPKSAEKIESSESIPAGSPPVTQETASVLTSPPSAPPPPAVDGAGNTDARVLFSPNIINVRSLISTLPEFDSQSPPSGLNLTPVRVITPPPSYETMGMVKSMPRNITRVTVQRIECPTPNGVSETNTTTPGGTVTTVTSTPITPATLQSFLSSMTPRLSLSPVYSPQSPGSGPPGSPVINNLLNNSSKLILINRGLKKTVDEKQEEINKLLIARDAEREKMNGTCGWFMKELETKRKIIAEKDEEIARLAFELSVKESELENLRYPLPPPEPLNAMCPNCLQLW